MTPKLYMSPTGPAVRSVFLCAKALGIELDLIPVDIYNGENFKPEYLKINPQHTVPTLVDDDGFVLTDSHVIMSYLISKYGKDKSLYPEDLKKRSLIDQRLHFDSNLLFVRGLLISKGLVFYGKKGITEEEKKSLQEAYDIVEKFLESNDYIAGDSLSIADFSFVTTITSWSVLVPVDERKHPQIHKWLKRMEKLPYYAEANLPGLNSYRELLSEKLKN